MIKPDVLVVSPQSMDFPYWRGLMLKNLDRFSSITHVFYNDHRAERYFSFVSSVTPWARTIDIGNIREGDWRNIAVNRGLVGLDNEWTLFLEQDFVITRPTHFFDTVFTAAENADIIGFADGNDKTFGIGNRLHPAFLLVRRRLTMQTRLNFAAHPELGSDHFSFFSDDLFSMGKRYVELKDLELLPGRDWTHYAGVTCNWCEVRAGRVAHYQPAAFREYVQQSIDAPVELHPDYMRHAQACLECTNL